MNHSKLRDPRFWRRWALSGAMNYDTPCGLRVLAVAGGAAVHFEESSFPGILGPRLYHRVWVGAPGNAKAYDGDTLVEAVESAVQALTPGDPLPW